MPARLCGSPASASGLAQRSGTGLQRGMSPFGHGRGDRAAAPAPAGSQGRGLRAGGLLCLPQPSSSRLCCANAAVGHQGSQTRLEAPRKNIHVAKTCGILARGRALPACPSGGDKPGASPSDKGRWDCSPAVPAQHPQGGSWGPPGSWLTLKPSRAHMSRQW